VAGGNEWVNKADDSASTARVVAVAVGYSGTGTIFMALYVNSIDKVTYSLQSRSAVVAAALRAGGILGSSGRDVGVVGCGMFGCHCVDGVCIAVLGVLLRRRPRSDRIWGSCRWLAMGSDCEVELTRHL
jgi:hypothetical protein